MDLNYRKTFVIEEHPYRNDAGEIVRQDLIVELWIRYNEHCNSEHKLLISAVRSDGLAASNCDNTNYLGNLSQPIFDKLMELIAVDAVDIKEMSQDTWYKLCIFDTVLNEPLLLLHYTEVSTDVACFAINQHVTNIYQKYLEQTIPPLLLK